MKFSPIITIGRQFGSGGREVAKKLAEVMNVAFYDKELLAEASKDSGICQEVMETYDEKQGKRSFFSLMGNIQGRMDPAGMYLEMPLNHRIFLAQFDTIRRIADEGPCVIVGRCADYVLRDHENVLNVFIKASMEERVKRISRLYELDPMKAEETIRKEDKQRATYYNYYATGTWGDVSNYHLTLDTGVLGVAAAVCRYVGVNVTFVHVDGEELLEAVRKGNADLGLGVLVRTEETEQLVLLSRPYVQVSQQLLVQK